MWIPGRLEFCWGNKIIGQLASGQKKNTNVDWDTFYQGLITQQEGEQRPLSCRAGMQACLLADTVDLGGRSGLAVCGLGVGSKSRENNEVASSDLWEGRLLLKLSKSAPSPQAL